MTLGTFEAVTALSGYSATRSSATTVVFSPAVQPSRAPTSSQRTDPPDPRPNPSESGRIVDQLYEKLMRESAEVLHIHE